MLIKKLVVALVSFCCFNVCFATLIDFEDVLQDPIEPGYAGFEWNVSGHGIGTTIGTYGGYLAGATSGTRVAYNRYGDQHVVIDWLTSGTQFDFLGGNWTSAFSTQSIWFEGYRDGTNIFSSQTYSLNDSAATSVALNWNNIDSLHIFSTGYQWVLDDFEFTLSQIADVPEPATFALFLIGIAGIVVMRKRPQPDVQF